MQIIKTELGCHLLKPSLIPDERGWFSVPFSINDIHDLGLDFGSVYQLNHSFTTAAGIVRGPNYQKAPYAQAKVIRCIRGSLYSVGVNIDPSDPDFGKWCGFELSAENHCLMYMPRTYAHGFIAIEDNTELEYFTDREYSSSSASSISWSDPEVGIDWTMGGRIELRTDIMSEKNRTAPLLRDAVN